MKDTTLAEEYTAGFILFIALIGTLVTIPLIYLMGGTIIDNLIITFIGTFFLFWIPSVTILYFLLFELGKKIIEKVKK